MGVVAGRGCVGQVIGEGVGDAGVAGGFAVPASGLPSACRFWTSVIWLLIAS
jgi:hypothetical protein